MVRPLRGISSVLVALWTLAACDPEVRPPSALMERTDSGGVHQVRVSPVQDPVIVQVTPEVRIGSAGLDDAAHTTFEYLSDVLPLDDERIVVIDNRAPRVAMFSQTGEWLFEIGRQGRGPGEYRGPIYGSVVSDTIFVWDQLQRRLSAFRDDGAFVQSAELATWRTASPFAMVSSSIVRETESGQEEDPAPAMGAVVAFGRDGTTLYTLAGPHPVPEYGVEVDGATGRATMVNPPALAVAPPWTVHSDALYLLDPIQAEVRVYDLVNRSLAQVIRLPDPAAETSDQDREAFIRGIQEEYGFPDEELEAYRRSTTFAELRPSVAGLLVDQDGDLWVAAHDAAARSSNYVGSAWTVLDLGEGVVGRVEFPDGFKLIALRNNRAYGISTLETGVHVVDVFRVKKW